MKSRSSQMNTINLNNIISLSSSTIIANSNNILLKILSSLKTNLNKSRIMLLTSLSNRNTRVTSLKRINMTSNTINLLSNKSRTKDTLNTLTSLIQPILKRIMIPIIQNSILRMKSRILNNTKLVKTIRSNSINIKRLRVLILLNSNQIIPLNSLTIRSLNSNNNIRISILTNVKGTLRIRSRNSQKSMSQGIRNKTKNTRKLKLLSLIVNRNLIKTNPYNNTNRRNLRTNTKAKQIMNSLNIQIKTLRTNSPDFSNNLLKKNTNTLRITKSQDNLNNKIKKDIIINLHNTIITTNDRKDGRRGTKRHNGKTGRSILLRSCCLVPLSAVHKQDRATQSVLSGCGAVDNFRGTRPGSMGEE